jgi:SAM-dependent methyltransferase
MSDGLTPEMKVRVDEQPDPLFYAEPRFVAHIDPATMAALASVYAERLPEGGRVLDLMSSWISHLPDDLELAHVAGLGLNAQELAANPRLDDRCVHDLNAKPQLPYPDESFDAVINAVSVQYLTRPIEVFQDVARILRPGGESLVAVSHRCFPTKAIALFHGPPERRPDVVRWYFEQAGGYEAVFVLDRSPKHADPLWVVGARKTAPETPATR